MKLTQTDRQALEYSSRPKLATQVIAPLTDRSDLSLAYSPGIAAVSRLIQNDPKTIYTHTFVRRNLAVITDGSAVLGLGNIGHTAAYPVMEGKAMLFKRFGDIDAIPLIINTQNSDAFIQTVLHLADSFAAINLEDISAPRCFAIESALVKKLSIPIMHDDQHGTAIVVAAALQNSLTLFPQAGFTTRIVIAGVGAAGTAITRLLLHLGYNQITLVDSQGIIHSGRSNLNFHKAELARLTNPSRLRGDLKTALTQAQVFIGVSQANLLYPGLIKLMAPKPVIFALANPQPEIMPDSALKAGAALVATGRSDFPNQINNALVFPGVFRGAIDARTPILLKHKLAVVKAITSYHQPKLSPQNLLPAILDDGIHRAVARSVFQA